MAAFENTVELEARKRLSMELSSKGTEGDSIGRNGTTMDVSIRRALGVEIQSSLRILVALVFLFLYLFSSRRAWKILRLCV